MKPDGADVIRHWKVANSESAGCREDLDGMKMLNTPQECQTTVPAEVLKADLIEAFMG